MIQVLGNEILSKYGVTGEIVLYRDANGKNKKHGLCQYIHTHRKKDIGDKDILICSMGAYAEQMGLAFPNNTIWVNGTITPEYKARIDLMPNVKKLSALMPNDVYAISQYVDEVFPSYYESHFETILAKLGAKQVDAYADACHSGATLAGFIKSGKKPSWKWINGIGTLGGPHRTIPHLKDFDSQIETISYLNFKTRELQVEIESAYPTFGNVFEATRAIATAILWLKDNPNKTVLCYVGDAKVF